MKIKAIQCTICHDIIFSRALHDCRVCSCGKTHIDGGLDYQKIGFVGKIPPFVDLQLDATETELYYDWDSGANKFGLITPNQAKNYTYTVQPQRKKKTKRIFPDIKAT